MRVDRSKKILFLLWLIFILNLTFAHATEVTCDDSFLINVGDKVTYNGNTIKLLDVSSSSVVIDIDGSSKILSSGSTEEINGITITVNSVDSQAERSDSTALLSVTCNSEEMSEEGVTCGEETSVSLVSPVTYNGKTIYATVLSSTLAAISVDEEAQNISSDDYESTIEIGGISIYIPDRSIFYRTEADESAVNLVFECDDTMTEEENSTADPSDNDEQDNSLEVSPVDLSEIIKEKNEGDCDEVLELNVGGQISYKGNTIELLDVSSSSAVIDIDGSSKIISSGSTEEINGITITVNSVDSRTERSESSASITISCNAECITNEDCLSSEACSTAGNCVACVDTDGDLDIYTFGSLIQGVWYTNGEVYQNKDDYCTSDGNIAEYFCSSEEGNAEAQYVITSCGFGRECNEGECMLKSGLTGIISKWFGLKKDFDSIKINAPERESSLQGLWHKLVYAN